MTTSSCCCSDYYLMFPGVLFAVVDAALVIVGVVEVWAVVRVGFAVVVLVSMMAFLGDVEVVLLGESCPR
jgi:uncharacterized membrane protein